MVDEEYWIHGAATDRPGYRERNRILRTNMRQGACSRFVHRDTGESFSVWLLNPVMFPLRPTAEGTGLYSLHLEPPYLTHWNWVVGARAKARRMHRAGDWFLREPPLPGGGVGEEDGATDRTLELLSGNAVAGYSQRKP